MLYPRKSYILLYFFEQNVNFSTLLFRVLTICISADSNPFFNCFKNKIQKLKVRKTEKTGEKQRKTEQSICKLNFFKKAVDKGLLFNYNNDCRF